MSSGANRLGQLRESANHVQPRGPIRVNFRHIPDSMRRRGEHRLAACNIAAMFCHVTTVPGAGRTM